MKNTEQKLYINGLKGIACLLIMWGHFLGIYKYAQVFNPHLPLLDIILASPVSFLVAEGYWLYLFFVISGYLVAQSKIITVKDVIIKSFNRFVRLAIPIFFAYFVIYLMYIVFGFHAGATRVLFQCDWYQKNYSSNYSLCDVFLGPINVLILGKCSLNSPYWVLRNMLIASLTVYVIQYGFHLFYKKNQAISFSILVIIVCASIFVSPVITACLIGMMIALFEKNRISDKSYYAFWMMAAAMMLYAMPKTIISSIFFASLIIYIPKVVWFNKILSSMIFQFFCKISWGIYSFHWPLICSVGAIMLVALGPKIGLIAAYTVTGVAISLLTILLSVAYYYSFERISSRMVTGINSALTALLTISK